MQTVRDWSEKPLIAATVIPTGSYFPNNFNCPIPRIRQNYKTFLLETQASIILHYPNPEFRVVPSSLCQKDVCGFCTSLQTPSCRLTTSNFAWSWSRSTYLDLCSTQWLAIHRGLFKRTSNWPFAYWEDQAWCLVPVTNAPFGFSRFQWTSYGVFHFGRWSNQYGQSYSQQVRNYHRHS